MELKDHLLYLSNLDGIAGREDAVGDYLATIIKQSSFKDTFKNYYFGDLTTKKKRVAVYAHLDEVGFFVREIDSAGFIRFQPIGSWWGHVILGQRVRITSRKTGQTFIGIVGTLSEGSVMDDRVVEVDKMYIDLGAGSRQEAADLGIQIGDMITPDTAAQETATGNFITGKALDNRVGCSVMAGVMDYFSKNELAQIEVLGVATAQEEAGTRGSKVAAPKVRGDINLIIDVANGKDTPKAASTKTRILGAGPGICLYDKTALADITLADALKETAESNQIPYQFDQFTGGGTDAGSIQLYEGKPTIVISVPVRYCHSWNSMVHLSDCENAVTLICRYIENFEKKLGELNDKF
ncbi:M42 family metallopeptidase [Enterococcus sp. CWB-B31]|uniref:M42 family metallopeptidase n=1 Tax=Enterococcus sp. CWB-B31 TaxID=2885159 RepID=UPI001E2EA920|nr:M20/M25/M40 family metallo-hydrolase [Enterococcus sp. CWB-B31]MCB5953404.1 M20/M25/M40 family metallo-hydrolase [Enterococcus sp. CWB-B31]